MFGSSGSPPKEAEGPAISKTTSQEPHVATQLSIPENNELTQVRSSDPHSTTSPVSSSPRSRQANEEIGSNEEKRSRRASGVARARDMFSNAKQSIMNSGSPTRSNSERHTQTPIQKLGKTDAALSVPQGSLNNAAGESVPGARSTFRVGVSEDKNKKCRRTMEDTHAYLYNFLSTPAPALAPESPTRQRSTLAERGGTSPTSSGPPVVETDNGYFAIFDGHAGTFAAEWCGKKLHLLLEDNIRRNPNKPIPELLDDTFTNVDRQLEKLPLKNSGCTAVVAVLRWEDRVPNSQSATGSTAIAPAAAAVVAKEAGVDAHALDLQRTNTQSALSTESRLRETSSRQRVLYTANVGDARIVLCRNGKALRLSYDHKGSDENEGRRITNAGGLILNNRVNGVLAVTRALGDAYMKDLVTGHPYTTETVIQPDMDEFLILACDGLWDVCSDQEAVDLIRNTQDPQVASKQLVDHALNKFSTDNLSCMTVRFNKRAVQDTVLARVEPIGVEGDPLSDLPGGVTEAEAIVEAAKRSMPAETDSPRASVDSILQEETAKQEPGPELSLEAIEQAKLKAQEGKEAAAAANR